MDDPSISIQSTGSTVNVTQLIDSSTVTNSSVHIASRINEADISVQPTTSMNDTDIAVAATTLLNEADISVRPTTPINEAYIFVRPTTSMDDADISVKATTLLNEAYISVQPTTSTNEAEMSTQSATPMNAISVEAATSMSEAGISVQPTYPCNVEDLTARFNKVKISFQSTVPMTVAVIPGQSSAAMHDADHFVEAIQEADTTAQPTDQINEAADTSGQPIDQISEADLSSTEEYQEAFRIFQWIEVKLDLLKTVQGNDENADNDGQNEHRDMSLNEKITLLERMLEEITHQMTSTNIAEKDSYFSKEVTRMLNMLQETTLEVLASFKKLKSARPNFKVLAILIKHLGADIGSEVKLHDVLTFIDGQRVMKLLTAVQIAREPIYLKMSVSKSNLELGVRRAQYIKRKSRYYKTKAEGIDSECSRTADIRSANQQLKTLARESEEVLKVYEKSVEFVLTKAKVFMSLKTDNEDVLAYFLKIEIPDMYTKEI